MKLLFNILRAVFLALFFAAAPLSAQEPQQIDYTNWESFASQAEAALDDLSTTSARLDSIRENAIRWRAQFQQAQGQNAPRIQSVREQIAALGPAPTNGETESEDVSARRKALSDQLAQLQAPGITATEAYSRADAIVSRTDQIERARHAAELLVLTPSPLLPSSWVAAGNDITQMVTGFRTELREVWEDRGRIRNVGAALAYLLAAMVLIYGRRAIATLPKRMGTRAQGDARAVIAFVVSLGQILIPMIGVFLLAYAADATGLLGDWATPFLLALPLAGLAFFGGHWLVATLFAAQPVAYATLTLPDQSRAAARLHGDGVVVMLALHVLLSFAALPLSGHSRDIRYLQVPYEVSDAGAGVIHFVLLLIASFFLFQLANVLRRMPRYEGTDGTSYRARILGVAGSVLRVIVVVALAAAMFGYINAANALFWPAVKSLGLIGLLILLQDFVTDLYALLRRSPDRARESLVPVLIGMLLILVSAPVFALIWGASTAELVEMRTRIMQGVSMGGVRLSPGAILTFLVVFAVGYLLTGWLQSVLRTTILPRTRLDQGARTAAVSGLGYIGIVLAALFAVTSAGIDLSNLALVAGALSVGIGFGMQNIVSNFVSGIILLIERPISVGDWIEAGGKQGIVTDISVRSTRIKTFDQTDVIVPNSDLISQSVTNWTRGNSRGRIIVPVGVAYGTDTRRVANILREIAEDQPTVLVDPAPAVLFVGFGADSLNFEIRAILSDIGGGAGVSSEIRHQIAQRFQKEGIEIPFAQRDIWLRNAEAIREAATEIGLSDTATGTPPVPPARDEIPHEIETGAPDHDPDGDEDGDEDGDGDGNTNN